MKKVITISVLIIFLLSGVGLYGILVGMQLRLTLEAEKAIDEDRYATTETITLQVPLTLPYSLNEHGYQRVTGEFEHQGEVYRLVKQKLHRDTLYIVCVKDNNSKKINQALADYVKTFTDRPFNAKQQGTKLAYSLSKDYLNSGIDIENDSDGWRECVPYGDFAHQYSSSYSMRIKYPPKFSLPS